MASIQTSVRLDEPTVKRVRELAVKNHRSFNNMLNVLLASALKREKEAKTEAL